LLSARKDHSFRPRLAGMLTGKAADRDCYLEFHRASAHSALPFR
jgi:hypothetical protein